MPRPPDIPDPLNSKSPIRYDDEAEDKKRASVTVEEMDAQWRRERLPTEVPYEPLELDEIPPERLEELRRRRDEILAAIRAGGGLDDGE